MSRGSTLWAALMVVGVLSVLPAAGCGDDRGSSPAERNLTFTAVLTDLREAAASEKSYDAAKRANRLTEAENAVVDEFCQFVWQVKANKEQYLLGQRTQVPDRIIAYAAYRRSEAFEALIRATLDKLDRVIDLKSLKSSEIKSYVRACY